MINSKLDNLDSETIKSVGLKLSNKPLNSREALSTRVFEYPSLENVYIMESDLYGNTMPKDSCFLAFNGRNGLIGRHLKVATLKRLTETEIENLVYRNNQG